MCESQDLDSTPHIFAGCTRCVAASLLQALFGPLGLGLVLPGLPAVPGGCWKSSLLVWRFFFVICIRHLRIYSVQYKKKKKKRHSQVNHLVMHSYFSFLNRNTYGSRKYQINHGKSNPLGLWRRSIWSQSDNPRFARKIPIQLKKQTVFFFCLHVRR